MRNLITLSVGYHSIILHTFYVTISWKKIYKEYPNFKEFICILLHDIGRINQDRLKEDTHPELGAKICGLLFGEKYYKLCITHSRDYANKLGLTLSKLGYADKYCVIIMPTRLQKILHTIEGYKSNVYDIKELYIKWWDENGV